MITNAKWNRPSVRFKTYRAEWMNAKVGAAPLDRDLAKSLASYSQPCVLSSLNSTNRKRLDFLLSSECQPDVYYPDIGFKTMYRGRSKQFEGDDWVFVIASSTVARAEQPEREQIRLRRFKISEVMRRGFTEWDPITRSANHNTPIATRVANFARWDRPREVFMDRLKKAEVDRLAVLLLAPPDVYVPGFGIVHERYGMKSFFLEVE